MKRSTPIRRWKPKPQRRVGKLGIVRLYGPALEMLRMLVYARDNGVCEDCGKQTNFYKPPIASDSYHMAHRRNKRMYGDTLENTRVLCGDCHRAEHGNPLPKAGQA